MRIAFITPEFVTDYNIGVGQYLGRMVKLLVEYRHQAGVFVHSDLEPRTLMQDRIRIERVPPASMKFWPKTLRRLCALAGLAPHRALRSGRGALRNLVRV